MNLYSLDYLRARSDEELRQENLALEAEQRRIREVRLQLAGELEDRARKGTLEPEPAPQVVQPATLVVEPEFSTSTPAKKRRRLFGR